MLAMARILRTGARLLLLDEITEGLAPVIVQALGRVAARCATAAPSSSSSRTSASSPRSRTATSCSSADAWWTRSPVTSSRENGVAAPLPGRLVPATREECT